MIHWLRRVISPSCFPLMSTVRYVDISGTRRLGRLVHLPRPGPGRHLGRLGRLRLGRHHLLPAARRDPHRLRPDPADHRGRPATDHDHLRRLPQHLQRHPGRRPFGLPAEERLLPRQRLGSPLRLPERSRRHRLPPVPAEVGQQECLADRRHLRRHRPGRADHLHRHGRLLPLPGERHGRLRRLHPGFQGALTRHPPHHLTGGAIVRWCGTAPPRPGGGAGSHAPDRRAARP